MREATNPISRCRITRAQVAALMRGDSVTLRDADGDEVTIDGSLIRNDALQLLLDGYPEQVTVGGVDFELSVTPDE